MPCVNIMTSTVSKYFLEKVSGKRQLLSSSSASDDCASSPEVKGRAKQLEQNKKLKTGTDSMEESMTLKDAVNELKDSMKMLASKTDVVQLRDEMERLRNTLSNRIDKLEGSIFNLENERDQLKEETKRLKKENAEFQQQLTQHTKATADLRRSLNDQEQHHRQWNLRVYGIKEAVGETAEDCAEKCRAIFSTQLGVPTAESDIEVAHRSGKPVAPGSGARPRPIIIRFFSRRHRSKILRVRKNLKGKGVSVGEDLTLTNYKLLRQVSEHSATMSTWSVSGNIMTKLKNGKTLRIEADEEVNSRIAREM